MESVQRQTAQHILTSHNLSQLAQDAKPSKKQMKSVDHNGGGDRQSHVTYNPYKMKDYKKIKETVEKKIAPKGLGSNIGDDKWQIA